MYHHYNNIFYSFYVAENDVPMVSCTNDSNKYFLNFSCFLIEAKLINNAVLISAVLQSDSVIHIFTLFFIFFYIIAYRRRLGIVPHSIQ